MNTITEKIDVVYQDEPAECGLACIAMLANSLGAYTELAQLRKAYPVSVNGMSLDAIGSALEDLGISTYPVRFDARAATELPLPAIVHYGGNHFVFIAERVGKYVRVLNPATGSSIVRADSLPGRGNGYAVVLDEEVDHGPLRKEPPKKSNNSVLDRISRRMTMRLAVLSCLVSIILLVPSLLLYKSAERIDTEINYGLGTSLVIFGVASAFGFLVELLLGRLTRRSAKGVGESHVPGLFSRLMKKTPEYFQRRRVGDMHHRFNAIDKALTMRVFTLVEKRTSLALCLLSTLGLMLVSPLLTVASLSALALIGVVSTYLDQKRVILAQEAEEAGAKKSDYVLESVLGIRTIKTGRLMRKRTADFSSLHLNALRASVDLQKLEHHHRLAFSLIGSMELVALLWLADSQIRYGSMTILGLFVFSFLRQITVGSATRYYLARAESRKQDVVDRRSEEILSFPEDPAAQTRHGFSSLGIKEMRLAYPDRDVVESLSMDIRPNEKIAVIGPSGQGKSTVLSALAGFHEPASGNLRIDDMPGDFTQLMDLSFIQRGDDMVFNASVLDNITLFDTECDRGIVLGLLEQVGLRDVIDGLPSGLNTMISQASPLLSSGQRQRLIIARALYSSKPIILLDEPTSNMDEATASMVMRGILESDKAVVMALHEVPAGAAFDRVIRLDESNEPEPQTTLRDAA